MGFRVPTALFFLTSKLISTTSFSALYISTISGEFSVLGCLDNAINCE